MIDPRLLRDDPESLRAAQARRGAEGGPVRRPCLGDGVLEPLA